jgi:hypothetical protein
MASAALGLAQKNSGQSHEGSEPGVLAKGLLRSESHLANDLNLHILQKQWVSKKPQSRHTVNTYQWVESLRGCTDGWKNGWLDCCAEGNIITGWADGWAVGTITGCADGCALGWLLGCDEGRAIGWADGWLRGSMHDRLSAAEGWLVGCILGCPVGCALGCTEAVTLVRYVGAYWVAKWAAHWAALLVIKLAALMIVSRVAS